MPTPTPATNFSPSQLSHTLPRQVAQQIGARIIEGGFAPGERLKEADLAEAFGLSRATIREALRLLESRGLVQILPQRGAQVTQLSAKELDDYFEIRAALLGLASRKAALDRTDEQLAVLQRHLQRLEAARDDLKAYVEASAGMVAAITRISGNDALVAQIEGFAERIGRYVRMGLSSPQRRQQSLATWRRLLEAIAARDAELAESLHRRLALENREAALAEFNALASR